LIAEIAPSAVRDIMRPAIETLAAIPSVVYGLFGLILLVPFIRSYIGGNGFSILAGGTVLAIMILPTIISISEDALRAVPRELREGSLALGATRWQVISGIVTPAALSGIITGTVLAMGRSIGETMAVLMVCGNSTLIPTSILDMVRPMTAGIALEWAYASGEHQNALFSIGVVLLIVIMTLNLIIYSAKGKSLNAGRM
jgi:phosphate transport system permease protein